MSASGLGSDALADLTASWLRIREHRRDDSSATDRGRPRPQPLQEGLFALSRLAEDGIDVYSMQFVIDIDGPVDVELLRRSAQAMLVRYPNLRAAFWIVMCRSRCRSCLPKPSYRGPNGWRSQRNSMPLRDRSDGAHSI